MASLSDYARQAPQAGRSDTNVVKMEMPSGDVYEGTVLDGKPHGQGRMRYKNGNGYTGEWKNDRRHGQGTFKDVSGASYEGGFVDGRFHGMGKRCHINGDVYEGQWKDGREHGNGTYNWVEGDEYVGEWQEGKRHGQGKMKFAGESNTGNFYEGEWANSRFHGKGTYTFAINGESHEGEWHGGLKHGKGIARLASGATYEGTWEENKQHGTATYTYADGSSQEQEWRDDNELFFPTPPKEEIQLTLASILLKDEIAFGGIDGKLVYYLADLLHESNLAQHMATCMEGILRPWLKGFRFDGNLAKMCSDAVMQCARNRVREGTNRTCAPPKDNDVMFLDVVDEGDNAKERYALLRSKPFETFLKNYATSRSASVRRYKHKGRTLFLSSIGKKSPTALGLKYGDVVRVVAIPNKATTTTEQKGSKPKPQTPKGKRKKHKKSNRKKSMPALPPESKEEKLKEQHSQALSRVFEEADTQFRDRRQRLAAINLERTMPKERKSQPKEKPEAAETITDNPRAEGLGGKAGKSCFVVQVGEASNLYNTRAKPSNGNKQPTGRIAGEVDLHCCTQVEALAKLDECLPEWMDTAMKGEYPWVICVRIVCGGGTQTLAEAVEGWIKRHPNVSNAPKNLYS